MTKILKTGNLAILEYPAGAINPDFEIDKHGRLFVSGYKANPFSPNGEPISMMKAFGGFEGYAVIGKYDYAKTVIESERDLAEIIYYNDMSIDNCVFCVKSDSIEAP